MNRDRLLDKVAGCFFGCAIGDALGYPVEFAHVYPDNPAVGLNTSPNKYSDDTQMTRAVAEGLIRGAQSGSISTAAEEIAEEFVSWMKNPPGGHRAPGNACMHGCYNLAKGVAWDVAGQPWDPKTDTGGGGCGAVMRSAPYGLWHHLDQVEAAEWAAQHAKMTHMAPSAQASAAGIAAAVSQALCHDDPEFVASTVQLVDCYDKHTGALCRDAINWAIHAGSIEDKMDLIVLDKLRAWSGKEALAAGFYCFFRHPDSFESTVLLAVNSPGDSDSIGAVAGALSGAYLGLSKIPEHWKQAIEDREGLQNLSLRFVEAMERARVI